MLKSNRWALKEWAVVVRALAAGNQVILLRKGGIREDGEGFRIQQREFFLFPTFEHQHRKYVRTEFLEGFDVAIAEQASGEELVVSAYAILRACAVVKDLNKLLRLRDFHIWTDEYLRMRFEYRPESPLLLLLLRTYRTPPARIPLRRDYAGCKSWVELDREFPVSKTRLAVPYAELDRRQHKIAALLELPESKPVPQGKKILLDSGHDTAAWEVLGTALELGVKGLMQL